MAKQYSGVQTSDGITAAGVYNCDGCAEYSFFNAGNVNVTIDANTVLQPRETWVGPSMHPELGYYNKYKIDFDIANPPTIKTPVGGVEPPGTTVAPGVTPPIDKRVVFYRTFITKNY